VVETSYFCFFFYKIKQKYPQKMLTAYQLLKTLHIVGFVSWFAGMFFLVRLFVNHVEALTKSEPDRSILDASFRGMEGRVYRIIMTPAMVFTFICGFSMVGLGTKLGLEWLFQTWFQWKLLLLAALLGYHIWCKKILEATERGEKTFDSFQFRLFNEVPTLFLVAIVLLGVFKNTLNPWATIIGLTIFAGLMYFGASKYRAKRKEND
jgi:protoporphyrinogen IX oxidase